jgi:glutathione synthase/RimK-type ligase-like ATP-grasp enzyme
VILIVTNRQDQTADFLILELKKREVEYIRFNTEDYPNHISLIWELKDLSIKGRLIFPKGEVSLDNSTSIWYRRPVSPVPDINIVDDEMRNFVVEESKVALDGLWKTSTCFWVSNPSNIRMAENKLYQLQIALQIGFLVWPTILTNDIDSAQKFYEDQEYDIVYKPLKKGKIIRGKNQSFIFTNHIDETMATKFSNIKYAPSLLQKYIHKNAELRITVIGDKVFTVEIDSQKIAEAKHDWRRALHTYIPHKPFDLPIDIQDKCRALVKTLGLEFGAIDLILTPDGNYVFLEINPNGQWAWIQQICPEIHLREALADLLIQGQYQGK